MAWEVDDGIVCICRIGGLLRGGCSIDSASGGLERCHTLTQPWPVAAHERRITITGWRDYS